MAAGSMQPTPADSIAGFVMSDCWTNGVDDPDPFMTKTTAAWFGMDVREADTGMGGLDYNVVGFQRFIAGFDKESIVCRLVSP
jgi:hypothetical protein